jgi:hypothetical protein
MLSKIISAKVFFVFEAQRLKQNSEKNRSETIRNEAKKLFLISQKQAKLKRNKMRFASFRFEVKIKKERKRDTLLKT